MIRYPDATAPAGWTVQLHRPATDNDAVRREAALQLVIRQRDKATEGGGTWQTWDWLRQELERKPECSEDVGGMDFNKSNHRELLGEWIAKALSMRDQLSLLEEIGA